MNLQSWAKKASLEALSRFLLRMHVKWMKIYLRNLKTLMCSSSSSWFSHFSKSCSQSTRSHICLKGLFLAGTTLFKVPYKAINIRLVYKIRSESGWILSAWLIYNTNICSLLLIMRKCVISLTAFDNLHITIILADLP